MPLQYKEYGDTESSLLVFLHGGGVGGWMWDKQVQHFTNYHCLVPTIYELDPSDTTSTFTFRSTATQLIELIELKAKGQKKVIVVGFSLGAQLLIELLHLRPDLIHTAMINSAFVKPIPLAGLWVSLMKPFLPLMKNKNFAKAQAKVLYIGEEYFQTYYEESLMLSSASFMQIMKENLTYEIPSGFQHTSTKILVTVGQQEKGMMRKSYSEIVNSNPNCDGIVIPNVGHGVSLAAPEYFNQLLEDWIVHGKK